MKRLLFVLTLAVVPALAGAAISTGPAGAGLGGFTMIDLGALGGQTSQAQGINQKGEIVGRSFTATGAEHAFLWRKGEMSDLGTLGGSVSIASAVNDKGEVVGYSTTTTGAQHAFVWEKKDGMVDLGTLGGETSSAYAINQKGEIVGSSLTATGDEHAFLWHKGKMRDLGTFGGVSSRATAINDKGQVAGTFRTADGITVFLWEGKKATDVTFVTTATAYAAATGLNEKGQIVGGKEIAPYFEPFPFLWQKGTITGLVPGESGIAEAINKRGQIVGEYFPAGPPVAFVWQDGVRVDFGTRSAPAAAYGINDKGEFVGFVGTSATRHATLWQPS